MMNSTAGFGNPAAFSDGQYMWGYHLNEVALVNTNDRAESFRENKTWFLLHMRVMLLLLCVDFDELVLF